MPGEEDPFGGKLIYIRGMDLVHPIAPQFGTQVIDGYK
jgi:hypothetical protein